MFERFADIMPAVTMIFKFVQSADLPVRFTAHEKRPDALRRIH